MAFTVTYITMKRCELLCMECFNLPAYRCKNTDGVFSGAYQLNKNRRIFNNGSIYKKQLQNTSGGPKSEDYLYDISMIKEAFNVFEFMQCEEVIIELDEGNFYIGRADIIRVIARKK